MHSVLEMQFGEAVLQPPASQMVILRRMLKARPPAPQSEDGVLEPILPPEELTAMYERILRDEFALPDGSRADPKAGKGSGPKPKAAAQLASAMGLTQLMLPFRLRETCSCHCIIPQTISVSVSMPAQFSTNVC